MTKLNDYRLKLQGKEYLPLMQGGMGVDISTSELALAVAAEGGVGHISDAMGPYVSDRKFRTKFQSSKQKQYKEFADSLDKSKVKWDAERTYQGTLNHVRSTVDSKKGPGAVFVNVMEKLNMGNPQETLRARLRAAMDGGIDGITLSAGLHSGSLKLIADQPRFRDVNIGIIVSSARALKIFMRSANKVNRAPDYIVVEGPLAGGHLGFGLDWKEYQLDTIVADVLKYLKDEGLDIPVIPAGGIFTGTNAVSFIKQGAAAVQVATRFTISEECGLPDNVKQDYLRAKEDDVVVNLVSPTGYPMRMLSYSPSLQSNVKPNCEALGYILDRNGKCSYHDAYDATGFDSNGKKLPVQNKMCICYHFMKYSCYTCGHFVYRLKETTTKLPDGGYYLPPAKHIFRDYLNSTDCKVDTAVPPDGYGSTNNSNGSRNGISTGKKDLELISNTGVL